ncbi:MAG: LysR family transcriptional regulator [Proteobacteria bacterium]|nr:LysR family transcriptional regulator [Pseudomonadota bacterium]
MKNEEPSQTWLNYHHLRHFWVIARHRSMTQAAEVLRVSQSTLSEQVRELEGWLGQPLFERRSRQLHLTEAGRIAFEHAESIFATDRELLDRLRQTGKEKKQLRIGAIGPLSKNLQFDFIQPLLERGDTRVTVLAGGLAEMVRLLHEHKLDLVLSNIPLRADQEHTIHNHLLGEAPVFLAGSTKVRPGRSKFPAWLRGVPLLLPTRQSHVRADFDQLLAGARLEPDIRAEVDDMALLRLLALSGHGLALVPSIVVERELQSPQLRTLIRVPGLAERFYAITMARRFGNPLIEEVVASFRQKLKSFAALSTRGNTVPA